MACFEFPSVFWHCWLGGMKGNQPTKNWQHINKDSLSAKFRNSINGQLTNHSSVETVHDISCKQYQLRKFLQLCLFLPKITISQRISRAVHQRFEWPRFSSKVCTLYTPSTPARSIVQRADGFESRAWGMPINSMLQGNFTINNTKKSFKGNNAIYTHFTQ